MKVELLHSTPLWVADRAIGKCWDKQKAECDLERIARVANKDKHKSTIEHLVYTFDIDGISRACLQELARHRIASYSVKSTRYTLKELKNYVPITVYNFEKFAVMTGESDIDVATVSALEGLQKGLQNGVPNDIAKYCLPESYKTSLVMTINARSLQNFLVLRTGKAALWEIQDLARAMYAKLPEDHKYLFEEYRND